MNLSRVRTFAAGPGSEPRHFSLLGDHQIPLPTGMTVADWIVEKVRWQNPRIRAFLGCIRLLGTVLESNYAILHCSPERLLEIWHKVRQVAELIRHEIGPLLEIPSRFPDLERARWSSSMSLKMLDDTVLRDLDRFPAAVPMINLIEVRKLLCVSMGKVHAFLQDTFGEIMANDPRSSHDADYFLSRRFPQDIDEAEWLFSTVEKLHVHLRNLERTRARQLTDLATSIRREQAIPLGRDWEQIAEFLNRLLDELTPKLKEVLALRGIRFSEMETIDRYALEIPIRCRLLVELNRTGREATERMKSTRADSRPEREQAVQHMVHTHAVISQRMAQLMTEIDRMLRDLMAFVPLWLEGIQNRRALLLKRNASEDDATRPIATIPHSATN